jgi:hypothetical protein
MSRPPTPTIAPTWRRPSASASPTSTSRRSRSAFRSGTTDAPSNRAGC